MKKLGLIGGIGPESTIEYYRQIAYGVQKRTGALPHLVIESLSVFELLGYCDKNDSSGLADYLAQGIDDLAKAGAACAALTGITAHLVYDELVSRSPIPIISMMDAAADEAQERNLKKVLLLGTLPTMSGTFFKNALKKRDIEVIVPNADEQRYIGDKISSELELGKVVEKTQQQMVAIVERIVKEEQVEAVVLGCTELPMILNDELLRVPTLNVMAIHIKKLIDWLSEEE